VAQNLKEWTLAPNSGYEDLEELHGEMLGVYRRYVYHVLGMIGGVHETLLNSNQEGVPYKNVAMGAQLEALDFLKRELWAPQDWLIASEIVSTFAGDGALEKLVGIQTGALKRLLNERKLNQMLSATQTLEGQGLAVSELLNQLRTHIFQGLDPQVLSNRELQKGLILQLQSLLELEDLHPEIKGYVHQNLQDIKATVKKEARGKSEVLKAHYNYCLSLL
jgi:DNA-directed RNA polymerase specialized sigma54-like protein